MEIPFVKCHGSGNDFYLIDEYGKMSGLDEESRRRLAVALCDREGQEGADGILFFQKSGVADARMRMFNPDGSEAEMCGNGVRCIGRYAQEKTGKNTVYIETLKGIQKIVREKDMAEGVWTVSVQIKPVSVDLKDIPVAVEGERLIEQPLKALPGYLWSAVSMGNPHLVAIVENLDGQALQEMGEKANSTKKLFPEGINVSFCKPLGREKLAVSTYERGLGITKSCGTGMSAATLIAVYTGHSPEGEWIDILNEGGRTAVAVFRRQNGFDLFLKGNATYLHGGSILLDNSAFSEWKIITRRTFAAGRKAYEQVILSAKKELDDAVS